MVFKKLARKIFAIYKYVFYLRNEKFIIRIFIIKLKGSLYIYIAMYLSAIEQVCFYWSSYAYTYVVYIYMCTYAYIYYINHMLHKCSLTYFHNHNHKTNRLSTRTGLSTVRHLTFQRNKRTTGKTTTTTHKEVAKSSKRSHQRFW